MEKHFDIGKAKTVVASELLWYDLTLYWQKLFEVAEAREKQKRDFESTRLFRDDTHFPGLLAEQVFALMANQEVNLGLVISGDSRPDFPALDTDVKGCSYWEDPWLKVPVSENLKAGKYALVGLDLRARCGYVAGWASKEEVSAAKIKNWGHGPQRSIHWTDLHKY